MKKVISVAMTCVGTMIGAGYASGQEITAFFGWAPSPLVPALCGLLTFVFTAVLLLVGNKLGFSSMSEVNKRLFGRIYFIMDFLMLVNAVVVLSAMIAGMDETAGALLGVAFPYGAVFCLVCILILRRGNAGLLSANTAVVPFLIVVMVYTCASSPLSVGAFEPSALPSCLTYVSMNLLLSASVLARQSGMSTKQIFASSALSSLIIAGIMLLACLALPNSPSMEMPLLAIASRSDVLRVVYSLCLIIAIFTTMLSALSTLGNRKGDGTLAMLVSSVFATLTSTAGFRSVVDSLYPVIGVIGLLYLTRATLFIAPFNELFGKRRKPVHTTGKHAESDRRRHYEIGAEYLTAVNDKVAQPCARHEILAHDRAYPRQSYVDFNNRHKGRQSGGEYGEREKLKAVSAHGAQEKQFVGGGGA